MPPDAGAVGFVTLIYHDYTAETYSITSGSGLLTTGGIIVIPTGVGHGWSQIADHVTYLSVRPDPDRVLPAGYVYPLLLKNQVTAAK